MMFSGFKSPAFGFGFGAGAGAGGRVKTYLIGRQFGMAFRANGRLRTVGTTREELGTFDYHRRAIHTPPPAIDMDMDTTATANSPLDPPILQGVKSKLKEGPPEEPPMQTLLPGQQLQRPEHAVISTFDLFSIGGECWILSAFFALLG